MTTVRLFFEQANELYVQVFESWLYIHFAVRTLILLLVLWMLVYACAQVFHYFLAPLAVLFCYHVLLRAWNFLIVETFQEWIYIHYYADDKPFLNGLYLRLCDRIKYNRLKLAHTRYTGILYRGRVQKISARLMIIAFVLITLWTAAFGLYNEYGVTDSQSAETNNLPEDNIADETQPAEDGTSAHSVTTEDGAALFAGEMNPALWPADTKIFFTLNSYGVGGSNIRDLPSVADGKPIEIVRGDVILTYLGEYTPDESNDEAFWLKVRTPSGTEGYISSTLLTWS